MIELCSADTLAYEENGSCNVHAVTIAAPRGRPIIRGVASCDPEGRSDALVKACFRRRSVGEWAVPCSPQSL